MEELVTLRNVSRVYAMDHTRVVALADVSLDVHRGELMAVTGPSGSGKSTLLNLIGCIDQATGGSIRINGQDVTGLSVERLTALRRHTLGFVFQTVNLIPVFTAFEHVECPLLLQRIPAAERRRSALDALDSVGLGHRAGHRPDLLSGGERQRVAVARAVVHRPAMVLADEATASLDTANATQLIEVMRRLNRDLNVTFVFSTHDHRLLGGVDRIVHLTDGRISQGGSDAAVSAPRV
jgi:putative ABC transport system ATP-binding protein